MEEKRVRLAHGALTYLTHGAGEPLLFLHGGFITPRAYIPLLEQLGGRYEVVAPTHPGHGNSMAITKTWTLEQFVEVYQEFLHGIHFVPSVVIGHSFGGTLALLLASKMVGDSIVVMAPAGLPFNVRTHEYAQTRMKEAHELMEHAKQQLSRALSATGSLLYTITRHPENMPWLFHVAPHLDISPVLGLIHQRVTILWGEMDGVVPLAVGERITAALPHGKLHVFAGKGHEYPIIEPDFAYREIIKGLDTLS